MKKSLYFAYGANLNLEGMSRRCPDAVPLYPVRITGWKLVFRGVADIVKTDNPEDILNGAIWSITEDCEYSLDSFEGYPSLYRKDYMQTDTFDNVIMFYKMNSDTFSQPGEYYYNTIKQGYGEWGLDISLLDKAVAEVGGIYKYVPQQHTAIVENRNPYSFKADWEEYDEDFDRMINKHSQSWERIEKPFGHDFQDDLRGFANYYKHKPANEPITEEEWNEYENFRNSR